MTRRTPLPPSLQNRPFHVHEARAAGVTPGRIRGSDLVAPFRAVRSATPVDTHLQRARAYAVRMRDRERFSHVTAAHLLGVPLPRALLEGPLHVAVMRPLRASQVRGVVGHELAARPRAAWTVGALRIASPPDVWVQLASLLTLDQLIVAGDFVVTGSHPYDAKPPLATIGELTEAIEAAGPARGIRRARAALIEIRYGCLSPQETRLRLLIERAGLPAPRLNYRLLDERGRTLAMFDGAYPEQHFGYEYMGDHHRADRSTYRNDLVRRARVEDRGWTQLDISADDLDHRSAELLVRIARRLPAAGASVPGIENGLVARRKRI